MLSGGQRVGLSIQFTDAIGGGQGTPAVSGTCGGEVKPQLWPREVRGQGFPAFGQTAWRRPFCDDPFQTQSLN